MGLAAGIIGAGALTAGGSIFWAPTRAKSQGSGANQADQTQMAMFDAEQSNLRPYMNSGINAGNELQSLLPSLTAPITMNEATLQQTPGYQFNLNQGEESLQNSYAA